MNNSQWKAAWDLCSLVRCALSGETADCRGMELEAVYKLAKKHSLAAISYMALEQAPPDPAPECWDAWRQARDMAVRKNVLLGMERQGILQALEEMGCWYMPLKGSVLAELYPKLGMRQMADNDILFDPAFRAQVKEVFEARGYHCECYGISNHDVYLKAPVYNFEMHVALFWSSAFAATEEYYQNVEQRLLPGKGLAREFSREDFYIYLLAHGQKHFENSGNGLRFLVDCYVYLEQYDLDGDYLRQELEKLGLVEFERMVRSLAWKLFGSADPLTQQEQETFAYCVNCGTYGTAENGIKNALNRIGQKGKPALPVYLLRRFWPDQEWFRHNAPFFAKWRVLKPCFVLWRCVRKLTINGRHILWELRTAVRLSVQQDEE